MTSHIIRWKNAAQSHWRGWDEQDIVRLSQRLHDPAAYSGGILQITEREYRALPERNRRIAASKDHVTVSPLLIWVEGRGLFAAILKE